MTSRWIVVHSTEFGETAIDRLTDRLYISLFICLLLYSACTTDLSCF